MASLKIRLLTLVLYITVVEWHVKSRRFSARLIRLFIRYSGRRPSYIILSSPYTLSLIHIYEMFARIDISDTGSGIPESEQAKIFARFYRSNSVQKQEGVGIGLYLARQIISGEGGYIKVASVPGKGSTFSIFLPK